MGQRAEGIRRRDWQRATGRAQRAVGQGAMSKARSAVFGHPSKTEVPAPVVGRLSRSARHSAIRNPQSAISAWSLSCAHSEQPGSLVTTVVFRRTTLPDTIRHHYFGEFRFLSAAPMACRGEKSMTENSGTARSDAVMAEACPGSESRRQLAVGRERRSLVSGQRSIQAKGRGHGAWEAGSWQWAAGREQRAWGTGQGAVGSWQ